MFIHVINLQSMVTFVNKHLNKINLEVSEVETQFHDGVYLTLLMGLLEGFFVPLHSFHLTPKEHEQKVHNVGFAFELMEEVGVPKPKARPEGKIDHVVLCIYFAQPLFLCSLYFYLLLCTYTIYFILFILYIFSDIVNFDLKSTLRVLYHLFTRYRDIS